VVKTKKLIDSSYENLRIMLKTTIRSEKIQGLLILGKAGFGKTYQVEKFLAEKNIEFHKISSYSTPLQFYKDMYEHRDKIIFLDDIFGLFKNITAIGMLLSALETDRAERIVQYNSTALDNSDVPKRFKFSGKIIWTANQVPKKIDKAFLSRISVYRVGLDYKTEVEMMRSYAEKKRYAEELFEFIERNLSLAVENMSLRMVDKIHELRKTSKAKWKEIAIEQEIKYDENVKIFLELEEEELENELMRIVKFRMKTGKSKNIYYKIKRELLSLRGDE